MFPGNWELSIIPENKKALNFWRRVSSDFIVKEQTERVDYDYDQPQRIFLRFNTDQKIIQSARLEDIPEMVTLSHEKRKIYEKHQPHFWKYKQGAEESQTDYFTAILILIFSMV
jgi:hypothetical protein